MEWKIAIGQRRFTSGHRTVGGEEEDHTNNERTSTRSRNMEEEMAEDRYLQRLGMDRRLLAI